jgi:hypothetical protein
MAKAQATGPMVKAIEALGERMLRQLGEDHPAGRQMKGEVNRLRSAAEALHSLSVQRSPLDTPAAHALKVSKRAKAFDAEVTASLNRVLAAFGAGHTDAQRRIEEKINLRPDAFAQEIRAAFRSLDGKARSELIHELVEANRGPELAAIVKAPAILTGITEDQRQTYEKLIVSKHAPAELDEINHLHEALEAATAATRAAGTMVRELLDPARLSEIESAAAAADQATAAFDQSLSR